MGRRIVRSHPSFAILLLTVVALAAGCPGAGGDDLAGPENTVQVIMDGTGSGRVTGGGSIDCPSNCGPLDWSPGLTVNLTAMPDVDSVFVKWSGDCTGVDPNACTFVVNGHMKVTATFNKL